MLKKLAMLTVLTVATVGVLSAQDAPPNAPKQGVSEADSGHGGGNQTQPQHSEQTTPSAVTPAQQSTTPTCDESCQQGRENVAIQRKLVWFTLGLVVVGFLQVTAMIWQAYLLRQTRDDVHSQASTMADQARDSKDAAVSQAETTKATLLALTLQATALDEQAKNTASQIELMKREINIGINKERAKIFVELVPANWSFLTADYDRVITEHPGFAPMCLEVDSFKIAVTNEGESTAYNASCSCAITIVEDKTGRVLLSKDSDIAMDRIKPNTKPIVHGIDFFPCLPASVLDPIFACQATLKFSGYVRYEDAFEPDNLHHTNFCYVWQIDGEYTEPTGGDEMGQFVDQSGWVTKPPEANRST